MNLTPDHVRRFWEDSMRAYGTRIIPKSQAWEMRLTARLLDAFGILSQEAFMTRFTTVWGRRIYPCFVPGQGTPDELWGHIVVCTHEHRHVEQLAELGVLRFLWRYLVRSRSRALLEADAYSSNLELHHWRYGTTPPIDRYVEVLRDYACGPEERAAARSFYEHRCAHLKAGGAPLNPASQRAIATLTSLGLEPEELSQTS